MKRFVHLLCWLFLCQNSIASARATAPLPVASAASQGFSDARLTRLNDFMLQETGSGRYLGAVTLIARNGKIVDQRTFGFRDIAKTSLMKRDAIFRIYSMTKTIASVAVLLLMEEGKLTLDDPVEKFLPDFSNMQVFAGGTAEAPMLRPAVRPITIRNLLTHTAGFATDGKDNAEVRKIFDRFDLHQSPDLKAYADHVARQPLAADPGERFSYDGVPIEVVSRVVEVVSGQSFDTFMQQRILVPLGMKDTGFRVPVEHRSRIADMASTDAGGLLILSPAKTASNQGEMMNPYPSGAGGLYSTAQDFLRFCQMLLNGGSLEGVSILGRKTVALMMMNHLGSQMLRPGMTEGFGIGGSVVLDVARRGRLGSVGQFGWSGAGATYYTIDPSEQLVAMLFMQHLPQGLPQDPPKISVKFYNLVYQSLVK